MQFKVVPTQLLGCSIAPEWVNYRPRPSNDAMAKLECGMKYLYYLVCATQLAQGSSVNPHTSSSNHVQHKKLYLRLAPSFAQISGQLSRLSNANFQEFMDLCPCKPTHAAFAWPYKLSILLGRGLTV